MSNPITSVGAGALSPPQAGAPVSQPAGASKFIDSLTRLVESVDASATDANTAIDRMLDGTGDVHEAMIALQKAEMTLQLTIQTRNKLVQAYQEIMRMPV